MTGPKAFVILQNTTLMWDHFYAVVAPLVSVVLCCALSVLVVNSALDSSTFITPTDYSPPSDSSASAFSPGFSLIFGGAMLLTILVLVYCYNRHRALFEKFAKLFLVLDIFMIFVLGLGVVFSAVVRLMGLPVDIVTFGVVVVNWGCVALVCLYCCTTHPTLLLLTLTTLHTTMAVLLCLAMGAFAMIFVSCVVLAELLSMRQRPWQFVSSTCYIVHEDELDEDVLDIRPRLFFQLGRLRVRSTDILWVGLAAVVVDSTWMSVLMCAVSVTIAVVLYLFAAPFLGGKANIYCKPVPVVVLALLAGQLLVQTPILPGFIGSFSTLRTSPTTF